MKAKSFIFKELWTHDESAFHCLWEGDGLLPFLKASWGRPQWDT